MIGPREAARGRRRRWRLPRICAAAIPLLAAGCSTQLHPATGLPAAAAILPRLSAAQLAGQRVIYSYAGVTPPAVLLSLIYPALDPVHPAGLSATVVQGELRMRLGFTGVTITDALEAGALRRFGPIAHRATLAARAGMDLLLCSQRNVPEGQRAMNSLERGYLRGSLNRAAFRAADERIMALRATLRSHSSRAVN